MAKTDTKKKTVKKAAAPKKKTVKKTVKKKAVVKSTVTKAKPKKKAAKKSTPKNTKIKVTNEQHHRMICEAAYYISLERTYLTVNPTEDWLKAEAAINQICIVRDE